jgi:hypothetical protein
MNNYPQPLIEFLPINAGVYYQNDFRYVRVLYTFYVSLVGQKNHFILSFGLEVIAYFSYGWLFLGVHRIYNRSKFLSASKLS